MHALFVIAALCVAQEPETLKPIDVRSTIHVEGVVVDPKGQPLEGVNVALAQIGSNSNKNGLRDQTRTDTQGHFSVEMKVHERPNLYLMSQEPSLGPQLYVSHAGFLPRKVQVHPEWLRGEPGAGGTASAGVSASAESPRSRPRRRPRTRRERCSQRIRQWGYRWRLSVRQDGFRKPRPCGVLGGLWAASSPSCGDNPGCGLGWIQAERRHTRRAGSPASTNWAPRRSRAGR